METILGLVIIYFWVHAVVVVFMKTKKTTTYEKVVLVSGFVGFLLYLFGTI